ncbi:c2h2 finger domain-containing protein [Colletotrichum incanum]|uniref:C2h2 finger domain-containing protein n=1 Tax=Colletotrichum incanum TaxID=1573173 RepID=A0A166ZHV8_COLIC|nr:c2h2 finger domain-containing protein [Colletotrichum incanum]
MAMETSSSFTARRQATQALPPFHLPSSQDIPSMSRHLHQYPFNYHNQPLQSPSTWQAPAMITPSAPPSSSSATSNTQHSPNTASSGLTSPSGVPGEGLSPLSSGVNTTSSQSSYYPSGVQGSWPTPSASYQLSSGNPQSINQPPQYAPRGSTYEQQSPMSYSRTSQSPATGGEGLPAPPYGQHQSFQSGYSTGGAGSTPVSLPSQGPPTPQAGILGSQAPVSTQPPTPGGVPSHVDSYTQSRPPATPGYYSTSSAPQQSPFSSFQQASPTAHSPTTSAGPGRGLASLQHPSAMAPPGSYRYPGYHVPSMGGAIMSNLTSPGHQMSLVPGMGVPGGYGAHHLGTSMYSHGHGGQPNHQTERPFKCDQCPQSFNRNHDLKRHKRIHLAVKPFPCNFCDKSFSRKDALKRHRLVKGCGNKDGDSQNDNGRRSPQEHSDEGTPPLKRE